MLTFKTILDNMKNSFVCERDQLKTMVNKLCPSLTPQTLIHRGPRKSIIYCCFWLLTSKKSWIDRDRIFSLGDKFLVVWGMLVFYFTYQKDVSLLFNVQLTNQQDLFENWVPALIYKSDFPLKKIYIYLYTSWNSESTCLSTLPQTESKFLLNVITNPRRVQNLHAVLVVQL